MSCTHDKRKMLALPPRKNYKGLRITCDGIKFANVSVLSLSQSGLRDDLRRDQGKADQAAKRRVHMRDLRLRGPQVVRLLRLCRLADGDQAAIPDRASARRGQWRARNASTARLNSSGCSIGTECPASAIETTSACGMWRSQRAISVGGA